MLLTKTKFAFAFLGLILIDQITKWLWADRDFFFGPLTIHLVKNFGLPFSINTPSWLSIVIVAIALVLLAHHYLHNRPKTTYEYFALAFIFAGAVSNVIDRVVYGYVKDFLDLQLGFVFNLADAFIILGIILLVVPSRK